MMLVVTMCGVHVVGKCVVWGVSTAYRLINVSVRWHIIAIGYVVS